MPELPEVEVTRRTLMDRLQGARIRAVHVGKPLRWPLGVPPATLEGAVVGPLSRRGKYLWLPLRTPTGADRGGLLVHLGMSGSLRLFDGEAPPRGPHDHVELDTDRGLLRLSDPRRFGAVVWSAAIDADPAARLLGRLGLEPLEDGFDGASLRAGLRGRRVAIKQALLAGDVVVGAGNIYVSEALFRSGIDPRTPAGDVGPRRCERLAHALREVMAEAVEMGGTTLRDFRNAHGHSGQFQQVAQVYDRAGEPCPQCGRPIRRIVQGQRATYFCSHCQR